MRKISPSILLALGILFFGSTIAWAAPQVVYQVTILPNSDNAFDLGTSTDAWRNIYTHNLTVTGTCTGCGGGGSVGLASSTPWTFGLLTEVVDNGHIKSVATSSLGLKTTNVAEGTNLYYTSARSLADFITNLAATTSVKSITTLPSLSLPYSQLTGTPTIPTVAGSSGQLQYNAGGALGAVSTTTLIAGTNVSFSGGTPVIIGTTPITLNASAGAGGITSLNGLTGATQTFATTSATGIGLSIVSTGTTHTFSPTVSSGYSIPLTASTTDWNTAFLNRITSLTTSGTSGAATLSGNTLNIPQYAGGVSSVSNSDGTLTISPTTGAVVASLALGHANAWTAVQTFPGVNINSGATNLGSFTQNGSSGLITALNGSPADPSGSSISAGANFGFNGSPSNFYGMGLGAIRSGAYDMWFQTGPANGGGFRWYTGTTENMTLDKNGVLTIENLGSGLLKSASGLISTAAAGTDYQAPITLTTTGSSGAATFIGNTLNVPQYAGTTYTGASPISVSGSTISFTGLATTSQPASSNILVSNGAAGVYGAATSTLTASSPLTGSFTHIGTTGSLGIQVANTSQAGYLTNTDWNTFNGKQGAITLTTTGTSGAATFSGGTLNIPQYAGTTYTAGTGLTLTTGTFSVNTSQNISTLSNLTTNGLVKTSGSTGALSIATAGTDYENPLTFGYPLVRSTNAISLAFGTTTSNTWAGTQTFTNPPVFTGLTGTLNASGGTVYGTATSTPTLGLGLSYSGTLGQFISGTSGSLTVATSSFYTGTIGQFPIFTGTNTLAGTSSINIATNGNIGIGTTTPGSILSIQGVANFVAGAVSTFYNDVSFAGNIFFTKLKTTSGTAVLTVNSSGQIGTTTASTGGAGKFGGTGADGALTCSSGTTSIALGSANYVVKNYTSISITGTCSVAFTGAASTGTVVIFRSQGAVTITSTATAAIDLRGIGSTATNGGMSLSPLFGNIPVGAQSGANLLPTYGSTATLLASSELTDPIFSLYNFLSSSSAGGTGSESGSSGSAGTPGPGGPAGGTFLMEVGGALNFTTGSTINANGIVGVNAIPGTVNHCSGGGGGGGGGNVFIYYNTLTANTGTITVNGGLGGSGAWGGSGTFSATAGGGGNTFQTTGGNPPSSACNSSPPAGATGATGTSWVKLNTTNA